MNSTILNSSTLKFSSFNTQEVIRDPNSNISTLLRTFSGSNDVDIDDETKIAFQNFGVLIKSTPFSKYPSGSCSSLSTASSPLDSESNEGSSRSSTRSTVQTSLVVDTNQNDQPKKKPPPQNISLNNRALPLCRKSLFSKYTREIPIEERKIESMIRLSS